MIAPSDKLPVSPALYGVFNESALNLPTVTFLCVDIKFASEIARDDSCLTARLKELFMYNIYNQVYSTLWHCLCFLRQIHFFERMLAG